jgi:MFS transporter, SP family, arabinose:H+ symporter
MDVKTFPSMKFICVAAAAGGLLFGFDTAVISGVVDMVKNQYQMDSAVEGWFVSSGLVGCILGVIFAGLLSDKTGRRNTLLLSAILFSLSAIGCAFSPTLELLIWSRLIGGIAVGIVSVIAPMFISEFAPASIRGSMVAVYQLAITIGIVLAYLSNALLLNMNDSLLGSDIFSNMAGTQIWRLMFLVMILPSIVFLLMMMLVPESPRWLLGKGKNEKAIKVLNQVYSEKDAQIEYQIITSGLNTADQQNRSIFKKALRAPLIIGIMLAIFQQMSGINAIVYYGPKIFQEAGFTSGDALQTQVLIGVVNLLFTIFTIYQADKFGRRNLLLLGLSGIILSLITVGFCFYTGYTGGVLLVGAILVYIASFAFSLGPVTWILINEIFPNQVRLKAVSICSLTIWISVWVIGQFFPWALQNWGAAWVFWGFAVICIGNLFFCLRVLKETKGQSLEEIEMIYTNGH